MIYLEIYSGSPRKCRYPNQYGFVILTIHRGKPEDELERAPSNYKPMHSFRLDKEKSYQQQFADMYFLRLTKIKPAVEQLAATEWEGTVIGDEPVKKVERVLDIRQGELCWVAGTVYMDMPLKPNILEDVSKDVGSLFRSTVSIYNFAYLFLAMALGPYIE